MLVCIGRKPTISAAGFTTSPSDAYERRDDRFNQEAFNPTAEGNLTRWRYSGIFQIPELTCPRCQTIFPEGMLICMACGLSLATQSDMRRACQVFRLEELAERLGFEFTLDLLGDDQPMGTTQSQRDDRSVRSAAAVLKNHARSYMKQARQSGLTLLQRLGTDAHFAYNCACMHWITVLGNAVLPNIRRTREEINTGKVRQYKARMCLVSYEDPATTTVLRVDDQVLVWFKNRFYRANHFAASYAQIPIGERFEVLSEASETFMSLSLTKEEVYNDLLGYVEHHLRPITEAGFRDIHVFEPDQRGGLQRSPGLCGAPPPAHHGSNFDARRKPSPTCYSSAGSRCHSNIPTGIWTTSGVSAWLYSRRVECLLRPVDGCRMGGLASTTTRSPIP
eukprot:s953_g26.t1